MGFVKNAMSRGDKGGDKNISLGQQSSGEGGLLNGTSDKLNSTAVEEVRRERRMRIFLREVSEDIISSRFFAAWGGVDEIIRVDAVQQYGSDHGDQGNESAVEQTKDEQISDAIRRWY